jgi:hypothetical protein
MKFSNPSAYNKHITTRVDKTLGYVYFLDKEHPLSCKAGKVYYHRHVYSVKIGKWIDRSYHVHHIDENKQNNDPSNLQAISPSKHGRKHIITGNLSKKVRTCPICKKKFITQRDECCSISCSSSLKNKGGIHNRISKEELEKLVWQIPTTKIAIKLNCSDVMINKLCKRWNISKPPRGYWAKQKSI